MLLQLMLTIFSVPIVAVNAHQENPLRPESQSVRNVFELYVWFWYYCLWRLDNVKALWAGLYK